MKSVTITEYVYLCLKYMKLRDVAIGLVMLCLLLIVIEILELSLKALLFAGLLFAIYKVIALAVTLLWQNSDKADKKISESMASLIL